MNFFPDPSLIPLPGPPRLLQFFLVFGWILHSLPMTIMLGGVIQTTATDFLGYAKQNKNYIELARRMAKVLPIVTALAITFGIVPLLFIQTIYGQAFFTSSVLMAWPWISIIPVLIIAYYGVYTWSLAGDKWSKNRRWLGIISSLGFLWIGFLFANNVTLMNTPEKWAGIDQSPAAGFYLNLSEPTLVPRYLFDVMLSLIAVGLFVMIYGYYLQRTRKYPEFDRWTIRYGAYWSSFGLLSLVPLSAWILYSFPADVRSLYLTGWTIIFWAVAVLLAAALLVTLLSALRSKNPARLTFPAALLWIPILVLISIQREIVRTVYLRNWLRIDTLDSYFQADAFILFAGGFLFSLLVIGYVLRKFAQEDRISSMTGGESPAK